MPLIRHSSLPTFNRLFLEDDVLVQDTPNPESDKLTIALMNMMPDSALEATERQFMRLLGSASNDINIYCHPFSISGIERSQTALKHISDHYNTYNEIKQKKIDALIVTGTNVPEGEISLASFWSPLTDVFEWCKNEKIPALFSCLATHAAVQYLYQKKRTLMKKKCWGVFSHQVEQTHPLVRGLPKTVFFPHSRMNDVSASQIQDAGLLTLIASKKIGVQLAVSQQHPCSVFIQGHLEYDTVSLLKEHKREIKRFQRGQLDTYPPTPENYYPEDCLTLLKEHQKTRIERSASPTSKNPIPDFPEAQISKRLTNLWHQNSQIIIKNWLSLLTTQR